MCISCTIEEVTGFDLSTDAGHEELAKLERIPWPDASDEMIEAAAYIGALYANPAGGTGGPLHVTSDDYNVEDSSLAFCRKDLENWEVYGAYSEEQGERVRTLASWILDLLEPMSEAERSVSIALGHDNLAAIHGKIYMPSTEFPIHEEVLDEDGNVVGWQWGFRSRTVEAS